jgi:hypothetical protein
MDLHRRTVAVHLPFALLFPAPSRQGNQAPGSANESDQRSHQIDDHRRKSLRQNGPSLPNVRGNRRSGYRRSGYRRTVARAVF